MTPNSLLSTGSVTETVLENCSAAYTRSRWLMGMSGVEGLPGAWPAKPAVAIGLDPRRIERRICGLIGGAPRAWASCVGKMRTCRLAQGGSGPVLMPEGDHR